MPEGLQEHEEVPRLSSSGVGLPLCSVAIGFLSASLGAAEMTHLAGITGSIRCMPRIGSCRRPPDAADLLERVGADVDW
jgi:hypothetical protein